MGSRALAHRLAGSASAVFSKVELLSRNAIRLRGRAGVVRRASRPRARGAEAMQLLLQTFELALRWTSYTSSPLSQIEHSCYDEPCGALHRCFEFLRARVGSIRPAPRGVHADFGNPSDARVSSMRGLCTAVHMSDTNTAPFESTRIVAAKLTATQKVPCCCALTTRLSSIVDERKGLLTTRETGDKRDDGQRRWQRSAKPSNDGL